MEKRKGFPKTAATLVALGAVATFVLFVFQRGIAKLDILDLESAMMATMVVVLVGTVLGFISWKSGGGKLAGILGLLILGFYVFTMLRESTPAQQGPMRQKDPQTQSGSRSISLILPLDSQKQLQEQHDEHPSPTGD